MSYLAMKSLSRHLCPALLLAVSCVSPKPVDSPARSMAIGARGPVSTDPASEAKVLDADTQLRTPRGATLTGAKGWSVSRTNSAITLIEPDRDLALTIVETKAPDAASATAAAWKVIQPTFARAIEQTDRAPARDGWDEMVQTVYVTTTQESRVVLAIARRKADLWHVVLIDGTKAAVDRRGAQLMTSVTSMKPQGIETESFLGKHARQLDAQRLGAFEAFIEQARITANVPGVAVAIVRDGKIVFEKGFGVRTLGKREPVTPNTLFMIGSTTKSLTTLLMARLVDDGRLSWSTAVTDLLPQFALGDLDATRSLTLANTVCACAGLPRQDMELLFEYAHVTPEMRVDAMKTMKPTTAFGETFQYSNTMVAAGGFAAARVLDPKGLLGPVYDAAMQSHVFGPLGMTSTTLDFEVASKADHASPHGQTIQLAYVPLPLSDEQGVVPIRPAGGVWSNVADMARYVLTELGNGTTPEGTRVVSEANLLKRRVPQVKISDERSYGLGLFVEDDHGVQVVHHGGNNLGFTSDMFFLTEHGIGAVVLTNAGGANAFRKAVRRKLLELLFDGHDEARQNLESSVQRNRDMTAKGLTKVSVAPDATWLATLVGTYHNAALGKIQIRAKASTGILDAGEWQSTFGAESAADGTIKLIMTGAPLAGLELVPERSNGQLALRLEDGQQTYVFERTR